MTPEPGDEVVLTGGSHRRHDEDGNEEVFERGDVFEVRDEAEAQALAGKVARAR